MKAANLAVCILLGLVIFLVNAPRAEAYVGLTAGSLITQLSLGSFLIILISAKAAVSVSYASCMNRIKLVLKTVRRELVKYSRLLLS